MADREPLQELVDSWTEQGVLDSQGRFTMRSDLALQKLRESQLGDPYVYALALFRAIVASGARRVEVDWDLDDLWWNFDGPGLETMDSLTFYHSDPAVHYLQVGILGALSRDPRFLRNRGPEGGWEISSPEQPVRPLPTQGAPQLQLRRRMGKTLLWSLARRLLHEKRELDIMRECCAETEIELLFKGQLVNRSLSLRDAWQFHQGEAPRLRLALTAQNLPLEATPPCPLHAVWAPRKGPGQLTVYLYGVRLDPLPLPWPDCIVAVSSGQLELDLSQQTVVQNEAYRNLIKFLRVGWLEILRQLAPQPLWHGLLAREILRPNSRLREEMSDRPFFQGRSFRDLMRQVTPLGSLPAEQEKALIELGARVVNDDLQEVLCKQPDLRGPILWALFQRHQVKWALTGLADTIPPRSLTGSLRAQMTYLRQTLEKVEPPSWRSESPSTQVRDFAKAMMRAMEAMSPPAQPLPVLLGYLEAALLLPDSVKLLARSEWLTELDLGQGLTLRKLCQQLLTEKELSLTSKAGDSQAFLVPHEIGQRLALGLRGQAITWNGRFCTNPLAADEFLALAPAHPYLKFQHAGFSSARQEGTQWHVPLYSGGQLLIDPVARTIVGSGPQASFEINGRLTSLKHLRWELAGEDKTHIFHAIAFSDGLRNYLFEERGKRYDSSMYSDSDTEEEVERGSRQVMAALTGLRAAPTPRVPNPRGSGRAR